MNGNGTCHCKPNFKGTACEQCADDNKFGPFCNQSKFEIRLSLKLPKWNLNYNARCEGIVIKTVICSYILLWLHLACTCVNGKCHNAPESNGTCKHDSCLTGFHGMNCDQNDVQCPSSRSLRCHVMASCVHDNNVDRYESDCVIIIVVNGLNPGVSVVCVVLSPGWG